MLSALLLILSTVTLAAFGSGLPSQHREPNENYFNRVHEVRSSNSNDPSAEDAAGSFYDLDLTRAPDWSTLPGGYDGLVRALRSVRDDRFLWDVIPRRMPWLYPDDGCYARAGLMSERLENFENTGLPRPAKLFVFGNLEARTLNTSGGNVTWWFHIVPAVRFGGVLYVFDPALEPQRPIPALEWILNVSNTSAEVKLSLCAPGAYEPASSCQNPPSDGDRASEQHITTFLPREWERLEELGRDPKRELGDSPPWQ